MGCPHLIFKFSISSSLEWNSWFFWSFFVTSFLMSLRLLLLCFQKQLRRNTVKHGVGTGGCHPTANITSTCPSHICLIFFPFVCVLHVQFCKAKSRCALSQVVRHQHSVTVSYRSLWYNFPAPFSPSFNLYFQRLIPPISPLTFLLVIMINLPLSYLVSSLCLFLSEPNCRNLTFTYDFTW